MLEYIELESTEPVYFTIRQMYNYLKIGFMIGTPHKMSFEIDLSVQDAENIIKNLTEGKKSLEKMLIEYAKKGKE